MKYNLYLYKRFGKMFEPAMAILKLDALAEYFKVYVDYLFNKTDNLINKSA